MKIEFMIVAMKITNVNNITTSETLRDLESAASTLRYINLLYHVGLILYYSSVPMISILLDDTHLFKK